MSGIDESHPMLTGGAVKNAGQPRQRPRRRPILVIIFVVVLVIAGIVFGGGWWVRVRVQNTVARRIEKQLPGTTARVHISSSPFLSHLAASGTILELSAQMSGLSAGPFTFNGVRLPLTFDDIDIHVDDLHLQRDQLFDRRVVIDRIRKVTVTAAVRQASLDKSIGLPVTLGDGTVGIGGLSVPATIALDEQRVEVKVPGLITLSLATPSFEVLPCIGTVLIVPGALELSCTLHQLPAVFSPTTFSF
ncbi:MAG: hypothetical protein ACRDQH_05185 [Pseudonocardiaceae bacterium]